MHSQGHQLSLRLMQRCPSCHAALQPDNIMIILETNESIFAHLSCPRCLANYLTYIVTNQQGIVGNAILTDQSYSETMRSLQSPGIHENDVLDVVRALESKVLIDQIHSHSNINLRKE
jgi:hypothetical protein